MRLETTAQPVTCPYCGERFEVVLDLSVEQQDYIEDCYVCCRPIQFDVQVAGDEVWVSTRHENE